MGEDDILWDIDEPVVDGSGELVAFWFCIVPFFRGERLSNHIIDL